VIASLVIAIAACGALTGAPAAQEVSSPHTLEGDTSWSLGTIEVGALAGYAHGTVIDRRRTATAFTQGLARFALHFGAIGSGAMRGNFAVVVEGVGMWVEQTPHAEGGGLNLLLRYSWASRRWHPLLMMGAGILYSDERIPPGETRRNFTPQAGAGLQYLITDRLAIGGEYRFHHLSNKGRTPTNPGINSHLVLFGLSWFH
jgi:opacity protein-like surface antigen